VLDAAVSPTCDVGLSSDHVVGMTATASNKKQTSAAPRGYNELQRNWEAWSREKEFSSLASNLQPTHMLVLGMPDDLCRSGINKGT
jgi:hypothetical protein